jgi:hypothetical protein
MGPRMIRVLSLGAGVQSTATLLLAEAGRIEPFDAAIFADTGWEPRAVYDHLAMLERTVKTPIIRVSGGNIRDTTIPFGSGGALDAPFFLVNQRGGKGMARRQCTTKLKVMPVRRELRRLMRKAGAKRAELSFGISTEESERMRTPDVAYLDHAYPLIDLRWHRAHCAAYLLEHGIKAPRSACIGCPYRSNKEWRDLEPDEFQDAVAWEREVQTVGLRRGVTPFVHAQRVSLDEVDLSTEEERGQLSFADECEGMCGV